MTGLDGRLILNGRRVETPDKLASLNPATLEPVGQVSLASAEDCRRAIRAAEEAGPLWRELPLPDKKKIFSRANNILLRRAKDLAELVCQEKGSPLVEALAVDVLSGLELLNYYGRNLERVRAQRGARLHIPLLAHKKNVFQFQPLGVTLVISPWNFPFVIPFSDTVSALVAGNTVVLRPSSSTPFTGLMIGEIFLEAGLPDGVLNVVNARTAQAEMMITDPLVQTIMFTGSVGVGRRVMELASRNLTHVVLELGGKDPMIVLDDSDLDKAARGAVWAGFMNTGQSCASIERVYVDRRVAGTFLDKVVSLAKTLRLGNPLEPEVDIGPMTTAEQMEVVLGHLADARARGAKVLCGGERWTGLPGYFLTPAVISNVDHSMKIMTEETFGPLLPVMTFSGLEEALYLANDSEYGLTASVWTRNKRTADWLAERLEAGTVTVNDHMFSFSDPMAIWGGVKKTGVGRTHGPYGLLELSNIKFISRDFHGRRSQLWWFPYNPLKRKVFEEAIVLMHHSRFGKRARALSKLLPHLLTVKSMTSVKNLLNVTVRLFRR
jgi:acyl-CoA reductase-like NAD-dependent aldehyde dehydrogenase